MPLQSTYLDRHAIGLPGMVVNSELANFISRVAEGGVGFGKVVIRGTADDQCKAVAAGVFDATVAAKAGNTGNGVLTLANPKTETGVKEGQYVVTIIEPAANGGTFSVEDPDGVALPSGVIGAAYSEGVQFTLADGATDFVAGDQIFVNVTQTGTPRILGISVKDTSLPPSQSDAYIATDVVNIMTQGVIWVTNGAGGTVTPGQPAFVVPSTGAITNVATAPNLRIPNAEFDSTALTTALAKLRINR